jgi:hypothetical protein
VLGLLGLPAVLLGLLLALLLLLLLLLAGRGCRCGGTACCLAKMSLPSSE